MPESGTPERKYALVRIKAGDWLLPSNSLRWYWRLSKNEEEGGWSLWRTAFPQQDHEFDVLAEDIALDLWQEWELWDDHFPTRGEAIVALLRYDEA